MQIEATRAEVATLQMGLQAYKNFLKQAKAAAPGDASSRAYYDDQLANAAAAWEKLNTALKGAD